MAAEADHERMAATRITGLDSLLAEPSISSAERWAVLRDLVELPYRFARRPGFTAGVATRTARDLAEAALGRSPVTPARDDDRWQDPTWSENGAFRRLAQTYLAVSASADRALGGAGFEWRRERRLRMAVENTLDALAPTNFALTNPAVLKRTLETGGGNLVSGARNLARDLRTPPRLPVMVDTTAFTVGKDLAVTPGAVVLRTPMVELLQYSPTTEQVRAVPLLVVSPMVNKYYVVDMRPGRSLVEYLVGQGHQVFALSWRNPGRRDAHWNLDSYTRALIEAMDAIGTISGERSAHLFGICAGGLLACAAATVLEARGEIERVAGLSLAVIPIDSRRPGIPGSVVTPESAGLAKAASASQGYISAHTLARTFALLRPNEAIWRFFVHNYLLGLAPPAHDILYWNADATNMSAGLHADFVDLGMENAFLYPDRLSVLDTPVDLRRVKVDSYVMAGVADHIVPWQGCWSATRVLGAPPRFVLSASGHVGAIITPTTSRRAGYWTGPTEADDADAWLARATKHDGSWWADWTAWLGDRSGLQRAAPAELGADRLPPLDAAPGSYVHLRP